MRIALPLVLVFGVAMGAGAQLPPRPTASEGPPGYKIVIESFAPTRPYAVGTETVALVGSIRNRGAAPVPADTVTLRMYALAGLDYLEGATIVKLPAMEPGASASFSWKVQPTAADAPLVAALALERAGAVPTVRVLPIQHFESAPGAFGNGAPPTPAPAARAAPSGGWIDNGKIRGRVVRTPSDVACLFLWVREPTGWRQVAAGLPVAELLTGDGRQEPWWEVFKVNRITSTGDAKRAVLTLSGQVGVRWRATVEVSAYAGSAALDIGMSLSPRRELKLHGIRLTRLHVSGAATSTQTLDAETSGPNLVSALRVGSTTAGMVWPGQAILPGWRQTLLPQAAGIDYRLIDVEFIGADRPATYPAGTLVKLHWRVFGVASSSSVRDALRITLPAIRIAPPLPDGLDVPNVGSDGAAQPDPTTTDPLGDRRQQDAPTESRPTGS